MFKNMLIATRLRMILVIAALPLLIFGAIIMVGNYQSYIGANETLKRVDKVQNLANLIHELQKERGMSVGFVASGGTVGGEKLSNQRKAVDKVLMGYKESCAKNSFTERGKEESSKLAEQRAGIDALKLTPKDVVVYYTGYISSMFDDFVIATAKSTDSVVKNDLQALSHLSSSKESMGQIRALLNGAFTDNAFGDGAYARFAAAQGVYKVNNAKYLVISDDAERDFYKKTVLTPELEKVFGMMNTANQKYKEGAFGIDPKEWFATATVVIDNLKKTEDFYISNIEEYAQKKKATQLTYLVASFVVVAAALIALLVVAMTTQNSILRSLVGLSSGLKGLVSGKGDISAKLKVYSNDEAGEIAKLFNDYLGAIAEGQAQDNALLQDAKAVITRVNNGWYSQFIEARTTNAALEGFKNDVNSMLKNTRQRFIDVDEVLETYAKLDYTKTLTMKPTDEHGGVFERLVNGVNTLQSAVSQMLGENLTKGYELLGNSGELTRMVEQLSTSANEQAASLEETAASLEEITSVIRETAGRSSEMAKLSSETKKSAQNGMILTTKTVENMNEIDKATSAINEAVSIIENISFQTNILSLNAAVEAATAGEAGKGFAVVAQEVRNLANRSAEAAKNIKELAEEASRKTAEGKESSAQMIQALDELSHKIDTTARLVEDVTAASKEQMSGVEQINDAVTQLDQMTQENASVSNQTSVIAENVSRLAGELVDNADKKQFLGKENVKKITV
jgi:methyl-accepting chemotaxis protein